MLFRSTATATAFNLFTLSASNCYIANINMWGGFYTGSATNVTLTITGDRNALENVNVQGLADAASAGGANARVVKLTGAEENTFVNCTFGIDTVARTAANSIIELSAGSARNVFTNCLFPSYATGSGANGFAVYGAAAGAVDRFQLFDS